MTRLERIEELNKSILRIEHDYTNIIGGLKAWNSGYTTELKPAAQKKLDKLTRELDQLQNEIISELYTEE
jgi:hypothetical protein